MAKEKGCFWAKVSVYLENRNTRRTQMLDHQFYIDTANEKIQQAIASLQISADESNNGLVKHAISELNVILGMLGPQNKLF